MHNMACKKFLHLVCAGGLLWGIDSRFIGLWVAAGVSRDSSTSPVTYASILFYGIPFPLLFPYPAVGRILKMGDFPRKSRRMSILTLRGEPFDVTQGGRRGGLRPADGSHLS